MNLLALETASSVCGVALFVKGKLVAIEEGEVGRQHAEKLPLFYDRLVESSIDDPSELDGIAVSIGPGSFTGLRIGLSFAKGLAFSFKLPLVPVPTLQAMVSAMAPGDGKGRAILHSHRDFVYAQDFSIRENRRVPVSPPFSARWGDVLSGVPDGTVIYQYGCEALLEKTRNAPRAVKVLPSALGVGEVALADFDRIKKDDFHGLEPEYVSHFEPKSRS